MDIDEKEEDTKELQFNDSGALMLLFMQDKVLVFRKYQDEVLRCIYFRWIQERDREK